MGTSSFVEGFEHTCDERRRSHDHPGSSGATFAPDCPPRCRAVATKPLPFNSSSNADK
jgi:hypothetical protein